MTTLALIGFLGGLITGISPCILPVLPVIFFSGAHSARDRESGGGGTVVTLPRSLRDGTRPYRVVAGLVVSFSLVTLAGTTVLSLLQLPQDAIRWVALVALVAIGLGLIFPKVEELLERPFARIPQKTVASRSHGFGLGLALGILYVPCAGPVLAAIVVAGATGTIGLDTVVLTVAFAVGAALPLLVFALAGRHVAERVSAFRRHQRAIRIGAGIVMVVVAVALVVDVPATLQRTIPDYTNSLQQRLGETDQVREKLHLGGIVTEQNAQLSNCTNGAPRLENCGPAPDIRGITDWLHTPGGAPLSLESLRGKVVLVDFWAYSCINCQRDIPHVVNWYHTYKDTGFEVIGVHTPEYAFERVPANVASGAAALGVTYPIALDNKYSTWTNYRNHYWPAEYLIDATGTVRHIKLGEGDYLATEGLIRQLLESARPGADLPTATVDFDAVPDQASDNTPRPGLTRETYFGVGKVVNYGGGVYDEGSATFDYPPTLPRNTFALRGRWALDYQGATSGSDTSSIALNYFAKNVYLVVGGTGTVSVVNNGRPHVIPIDGPPNLHQIVAGDNVERARIEVRLTQGLQAFSFSYG